MTHTVIYLPLYIFCGKELLYARLRPASIDGAAGTVKELETIIERVRATWPDLRIIIRGDSGYYLEDLMLWCESMENIDFIFGLPKNKHLLGEIKDERRCLNYAEVQW